MTEPRVTNEQQKNYILYVNYLSATDEKPKYANVDGLELMVVPRMITKIKKEPSGLNSISVEKDDSGLVYLLSGYYIGIE